MPERFEIYIVYKRRYINTLPFLSFSFGHNRIGIWRNWICRTGNWRIGLSDDNRHGSATVRERSHLVFCLLVCTLILRHFNVNWQLDSSRQFRRSNVWRLDFVTRNSYLCSVPREFSDCGVISKCRTLQSAVLPLATTVKLLWLNIYSWPIAGACMQVINQHTALPLSLFRDFNTNVNTARCKCKCTHTNAHIVQRLNST